MEKELEIFTLGGLKILHKSTPVTGLASRKAHALLIYLAVAGSPQSRDHLADLLWQDRTQAQARANLRVLLSSIKKRLKPFIRIDQESVSFEENATIRVDVAELQECLDVRNLDHAVDLYKGRFLEGFHVRGASEFDHWVIVQNERFLQQMVEALQVLVEQRLKQGEYQEGLVYARRLLALNSLMESAHRNLMRMLALGGHRDQALAQYQICKDILASELSVEPSAETTILNEQIVAGTFTLEFHALKLKYDIPEKVTPFVGRRKELEKLERLLSDEPNWMITIAGPGGIGKSRLAIEVTKRVFNHFPDGIFYISLVGLDSIDSIFPALAEAMQLKVGEAVDPDYWVKSYLRKKKALLLLDNFEHLLSGNKIVKEILEATSMVKVLVTSRVKLSIEGELVYWLEGMDVPPLDIAEGHLNYCSFELFVKRAYGNSPKAVMSTNENSQVSRICYLVEGLPLGIELAAAWIGVLTPKEIVDELDSSIDLLKADVDTLPERQRSFRAVFDHSWMLLTEHEQAVLGALSVFRGGFNREGAAFVAGATNIDLRALVNKSLIYSTGNGRYKFHELLRQCTAEKLHAFPHVEDRVRDLHCEFFSTVLVECDLEMKGEKQLVALSKIKLDIGNIQRAWNWAIEGEHIERVIQDIDGLCRFYTWRRRTDEGVKACRSAVVMLDKKVSNIESESTDHDARRTLMKTITWLSTFLTHEDAKELLGGASVILRELQTENHEPLAEEAAILRESGNLVVDFNRQEACELYEGSLKIYDELDYQWEKANLLTALGWVAIHSGEYQDAREYGQKSLSLHSSFGEPRGMADSLWLLGSVAILELELKTAEELISESLEIRQRIGERITDISSELQDIGMTLTWIGKLDEALDVRLETLDIYLDRGLSKKIPNAYVRLAFSQMHSGHYDDARESAAFAQILAKEIDDQRVIGLASIVLGFYELIQGDIESANLFLDQSANILRQVEGAGELGWALSALALAKLRLGQHQEYCECLIKALDIGKGFLSAATSWIALSVYAFCLVERGDIDSAIELYALISQFPLVVKSHGFYFISGRYVDEASKNLPADIVAEARERGLNRDLYETISEVKSNLRLEIEA